MEMNGRGQLHQRLCCSQVLTAKILQTRVKISPSLQNMNSWIHESSVLILYIVEVFSWHRCLPGTYCNISLFLEVTPFDVDESGAWALIVVPQALYAFGCVYINKVFINVFGYAIRPMVTFTELPGTKIHWAKICDVDFALRREQFWRTLRREIEAAAPWILYHCQAAHQFLFDALVMDFYDQLIGLKRWFIITCFCWCVLLVCF